MLEKLKMLRVPCILLLLLIPASSSRASSAGESRLKKLNQLNLKRIDLQGEQVSSVARPVASVGSYSADGGSPGYIIGRSWKDDQAHINPGRTVGRGGGSPLIHFVYTNQPGCPGADNVDVCARFLHYNYYDPTAAPTGEISPSGYPVQTQPFVVGGMYASADVDETGHMIITGERFESPEGAAAIKRVGVFWDNGGISYGQFIGDTIPGEPLNSERYHQPEIEYQEFNGEYVTHIISVGDYGPIYLSDGTHTRQLIYWRKVNSNSGPWGIWTSMVFEDTSWSDQYSMGAEHDGGGNFGIAWVRWRDASGSSELGGHIYVLLSSDAGANFAPIIDIVPWDYNADSWQPWIECNALMDHDGYFHVVWNANEYSAASHSASGIDPARVYHWTNRVFGPIAGGTTSLVTVADFDGLAQMCGRGPSGMLNVGHAEIAECNNRLYATWVQYGDPENGDTSDCANQYFSDELRAAYNGDVFMSVSLSLNGSLWDAGRNLTNSKSPNCDTTAGNECDDDNYPSLSRYGMNDADFGTLYWSAVPQAFQVAEYLDPMYSDGYFLDVQFVDDLVPGPARYAGDGGIWTYNPLKWFRLPCVAPVVQPRIYISQDDFVHPVYWVKSGQEETVDLLVENIGNDVLHVTNVSANYIQGGSGWLSFLPSSFTVDAASSDVIQVTINPGGAINPPAGTAVAIQADVVITSNDPHKPTCTWPINTVIADTVVQIRWDTVVTGQDVALTVDNRGAAGCIGIGKANLDFARSYIDCDTTQDVYLYDMTPILMTDATHYSWNPHWTSDVSKPFNFMPINKDIRKRSFIGSTFNGYNTDKFVNSDSSIALVKYWYAPSDNVSFVVERLDVVSNDGGAHSGVRIGEWIDWDVPSDTGTNNQGGFSANPGSVDYLWQQGLMYDPGARCQDNNRRYAASGLLGYFRKSEYDADENVNHTGLFGGFVLLDDDIFARGTDDTFIPDSAWAFMNRAELTANNTVAADQQIWLSFGSFTIDSDTLTLWVVHASMYDGNESGLQGIIDAAEAWYLANRSELVNPSCCGEYTGGYTGNTDCSPDGRINLADLQQLIDRVYGSRSPLCCEEDGNVDGDPQQVINLGDITRLLDYLYVCKYPTAYCQ